MDAVSEEVAARIHETLAAEGEMVTAFVAVIEVVDADGRRWLRTLVPDTVTPWATIGMLDYALNDEKAPALENQE